MEDEWETIHPSTSDSDDSDAVIPTTPTNFTDPPQDNHHLQEPPHETPSPPSSHSSTTTPYEIVEGELPHPPKATSLGVLSSWILRIGYGVRRRIGVWSIVASVGAFVTVTMYARRWRRRRRILEKGDTDTDKLMLLLNQKDEKIKQLLLQIDRMNEMLLARRRVPVIRVVVDSPMVIGPRLN